MATTLSAARRAFARCGDRTTEAHEARYRKNYAPRQRWASDSASKIGEK